MNENPLWWVLRAQAGEVRAGRGGQTVMYPMNDPGIRESITEAEADVEEGRVYSEEQIRAEFNLPKGER